jgi:hypothetical protein
MLDRGLALLRGLFLGQSVAVTNDQASTIVDRTPELSTFFLIRRPDCMLERLAGSPCRLMHYLMC